MYAVSWWLASYVICVSQSSGVVIFTRSPDPSTVKLVIRLCESTTLWILPLPS